MKIGIFDVLVILSVFYLSFQICINLLPNLMKNKKIGDSEYVKWIVDECEKMFIKITAKKVKIIIWGASFLTGFLFFSPLIFLNPSLAALMFFMGFIIGRASPKIVLKVMKKRRVTKFNLQMIDGLTVLSNGLKSGLTITQGLENVAKQMPNPISQEFNLVLSEQRVGRSVEEAFINLGKRVECEDVEMFVTAVIILRETGGSLSETIDTIVSTIRERIKIQQKISALVSQGVMQGIIIFLMPFALGLVFYFIDPNHIMPMLTTFVGNIFLLIMLTLQILGGFVMWKIIKIEV